MNAPILHIASRGDWQAAQAGGSYTPASLAAEGFIHCSTPAQLLEVANAFYAGRTDLVLLVIDPGRLLAELRWEAPAHPGPPAPAVDALHESFPHLYGPLNLQAVAAALDFAPGPDGRFSLPPELAG